MAYVSKVQCKIITYEAQRMCIGVYSPIFLSFQLSFFTVMLSTANFSIEKANQTQSDINDGMFSGATESLLREIPYARHQFEKQTRS